MNPKTLDFQLTAIDRALLGLLEERSRLLAEADSVSAKQPDINDLQSNAAGLLHHDDINAVFGAIHAVSLRSIAPPAIFGLGSGGAR